jgi:hypothetical protein
MKIIVYQSKLIQRVKKRMKKVRGDSALAETGRKQTGGLYICDVHILTRVPRPSL